MYIILLPKIYSKFYDFQQCHNLWKLNSSLSNLRHHKPTIFLSAFAEIHAVHPLNECW